MQMKKIIGILLAMCFVLSVTAAAVSAHPGDDHNYRGHGNHWNDWNGHNGGHHNGGHYVPGHFETKIIKNVVYKHHEKIVIKKIIKVWVPGHWVQNHYRW